MEGSWGPLLGIRLTAQLAGDSRHHQRCLRRPEIRSARNAAHGQGQDADRPGAPAIQRVDRTRWKTASRRELAPNRDIGVQLQGEFASGGASYALGVYNGAPDGRDGPTTNPDNEFELAGRLFFEPWKNAADGLSGLGFGIAGSTGDKEAAATTSCRVTARPGQVQFFGYRSDVAADGEHIRWSPQAYYYRGRFGLLGEYIVSRQELALPTSGVAATMRQPGLATQRWRGPDRRGQTATAAWSVRTIPLQPMATGWGAFELVARYGRLDIDDDAFPLFADPAAAVAGAQAGAWASTGTSPATSSSSPITTRPLSMRAPGWAASAKTKRLS